MCSDLKERMGRDEHSLSIRKWDKRKVRHNYLNFLDEVRGRMGQSLNV